MRNYSPKFIFITGALWSVGTRWTIKLAGFLNTVIMARLIIPSDYGVVAMAMLVIEIIHAFTDVGAETAILRIENPTKDEIDSAWTLRLFQSAVVSFIVIVIAPYMTLYFKEPRVEPVLWVFALCILLYGTTNIGLTLAHKAFQFSVFFRVSVFSKIFSVLVTLIAGFILKDYRALVLGVVSGYTAGVVLSYVMHPYRPKVNTKKIEEIWKITKWLMLTSMGSFLLRRSDEVVASRIAGTQDYGIYHVGADLGRLPVSELGPAMMRAFLPVLSSMQGDMKRTNAAVLKTLSALNVITIPVGFGIASVATPLTEIILGSKWSEAAPFVAIYALAAAVQFIVSPLTTLLILKGHTKIQSSAIWIEFIIFSIFAFLLISKFNLVGLAIARLIASTFNIGLTAYFSWKYCGINLYAVAFCIVRPLAGSIIMSIFVVKLTALMQQSVYLEIFAGASLGALFYSLWIFCTWLIFKKPQGLESTIFDFFVNYRNKYKPLENK